MTRKSSDPMEGPGHRNEILSVLLDATTESAMLVEMDGTILAINEEGARRFGRTAAQMIGTGIGAYLPEDLFRLRMRQAELVRETKKPVTYADTRNGRWYDNSLYPVFDPAGDVTKIAVFARDITEQRETVLRLKESEERYRNLFQNNHAAMLLIDPESSRIVDANPAACRFYGYDREALLRKSIADLNLLSRAEVFEEMERARTEKRRHFLFRHRLADRSIRDVEVYSGPIRIDGRQLLYSIIYDITERRQAEETVRESETRYRQLFNEMISGFALHEIILDEKGNPCDYRFQDANPAFEKMTGLKCRDILGRRVREVLPDIEPLWIEKFGEVAMTGRPAMFENYSKPLNKHFEVMAFCPQKGRFAVTFFDVTDRINANLALQQTHEALELRVQERTAELARLNEALQAEIRQRKETEELLRLNAVRLAQSNRALQDFAFIASHDLQEPLRKIRTFGEILKNRHGDRLDETGRDYLERMGSAADRMRKLIEGLLEYSRVSTRANPFQPVDLNVIVEEVLCDLEIQIARTGARIEVEQLAEVEADPVQMRQLFQNLTGNALKFRGEQPPVIRIWGRHGQPSPDGPERFQVRIADNGIGFDEKHLDRIFKPFERLHGRSEYEGAGIGLAICKKIMERHGGTITAKSAPGQGAEFIIELPVASSLKKISTRSG